MKKALFTITFLLGFCMSLFADAIIVEFVGAPARDKIVLNWRTGDEAAVNLFIVERSSDKKVFTKAGEVPAKGSNSEYEYVDSNLTSVNNVYYYRLRIRRTDGTFQSSEIISVIPKLSSFAKTWGSIKALFQ